MYVLLASFDDVFIYVHKSVGSDFAASLKLDVKYIVSSVISSMPATQSSVLPSEIEAVALSKE